MILNTGDGLKTLDAVEAVARPTATIPATLDAFRAAGLKHDRNPTKSLRFVHDSAEAPTIRGQR